MECEDEPLCLFSKLYIQSQIEEEGGASQEIETWVAIALALGAFYLPVL